MGWFASLEVEGKQITKEWSQNDAEAVATRHIEAAAMDNPAASTTGRNSIL